MLLELFVLLSVSVISSQSLSFLEGWDAIWSVRGHCGIPVWIPATYPENFN